MFVPMTPEQMQHHEENREAVARIVAKWRRYGYLSEADQQKLMIFLQNMRMSCNSTYLLDKKTDYGVKADELAVLLGEMLEDPRTKVVIFSQTAPFWAMTGSRFEGSPTMTASPGSNLKESTPPVQPVLLTAEPLTFIT